jgi:serine/threonine-protein kinase
MPPEAKLDTHAVKTQLDRLLLSKTFKTSPRLREFLKVTALLTCEGRESEISQFLIATVVFKRPAELFDPQIDPIVRVEAARLRAKLREYYETQGQDDPILVQYPKGGYIPCFDSRIPRNTLGGPPVQLSGPLADGAANHAPGSRLYRVAVLPFRNLGPQRTLAYLGEAVAAQVISRLASVSCIRVVSQTSSFQYVSEDKDIRDIGKELGVDVVIDGAVRSAGRELRVTSQINDTGTGYLIWSKVFDWLRKDTLAMQEEVARTVAAVVEALCPPELGVAPGHKPGGVYFDAAPQLS